MKTTRLLTIIIVLQIVTLAGQWVTGPSGGFVSPAQAQIPDAGAQRMQMVEELKGVNEKLGKMISLMESGNLQVRVLTPDEGKQAKPAK